ncbi:MAG TPA: ATP-binding protein [Polyangiaceae bacterium]|nr:ATP-binding protein [Polyangiaceae bacterium]
MDVLATVLAATDAIELFGALLFANAFVRRPDDREDGLAALLCLAAAVHTSGTLAGVALGGRTFGAALAARLGAVGMLAALPVAVHFALVYSRGARPRLRWLAPGYLAAAVIALLELVPRAPAQPSRATPFDHLAQAMTPVGEGTFFVVFGAATVVLVLVAHAYLVGQRGALAVVLGATVLLAAVINDIGVASGAFSTVYLSDLGFAAFIVGIATTPGARYASVALELERRTDELRGRTRELRRSYEDLRTAQEELVKKEQLAVVGELAAVIAHEVRNPLAIIANAGAGLRKPAISREDHDTLLAILDEETSRLNRLVTDLLRYARPVNVQRSHLPLPDLLERAMSLASANNASKTGIRAELRVEAQEARIWGDANLLRQVFDNLIDNAMQAMGPEGALTVRVRGATEGGIDGLAVDIIDTGEGMDTQVRSRALDPFFTTRPSGTGLGLAIVDRIVDAHGGRLGIESHAGEGTTVTVFLPHGLPTEPPAARGRGTRTTSDPARERVP